MAATGTAVLLAILNLRGCWFFRYGRSGSVFFVCVFTWIVVFLALKPFWRTILLASSLALAFPIIGTRYGNAEENAGPESAVVAALHQLGGGLSDYRKAHETYPERMPVLPLPPPAEKFYRFQYLPLQSPDGRITGYTLQATPVRRDCDFH